MGPSDEFYGGTRAVKIALIQQAARGSREENIATGLANLNKAAAQGANVAAFAELAFTRFYPQRPAPGSVIELAEPIPGPTTDVFCKRAGELKLVVVLNLFERAGEHTFDSSPVIDADGAVLGVTRMAHIIEAPFFHESSYYAPGDKGARVYRTKAGAIGVSICYDRHFPEYMRALALAGADLVVIPQAGTVGEWPEGLYEAEVRVAAFQNGYFAALVNRVGREDQMVFSGSSFVAGPDGKLLAQASQDGDDVLVVDLDPAALPTCHARRHFLPDRRPEIYDSLCEPE
jgi:N-carbamoylputrescine amidase